MLIKTLSIEWLKEETVQGDEFRLYVFTKA